MVFEVLFTPELPTSFSRWRLLAVTGSQSRFHILVCELPKQSLGRQFSLTSAVQGGFFSLTGDPVSYKTWPRLDLPYTWWHP